jgi:hypothetical protein
MSPKRLLTGTLVCAMAALVAFPIGLSMGGFPLCKVRLTDFFVGSSILIAGTFAGVVASIWRKAWWAGSLAFTLPLSVGFVFVTDWDRAISLALCGLASLVVAFVVRYPGPQSLKS